MNAKEYEINKNILENFKFKNFKILTETERENIAIEFSNEIFNFYNLEPIKILFRNTKDSSGTYSHFDLNDKNDFSIKINDIFLTSKEKKDCFKFLATLIHEAEHYRQEIQEPEKYLQTLKSPTVNVGFYINQPHEKEAHEFEIKILKSMQSFFDDPNFDDFIKHEELEINEFYRDENSKAQRNGFLTIPMKAH